ncbi:armadillo-type protein [Paraphysoderma sedebokerense]|nr:armadillo-type protein [Paraphysoderma sedebokerense]
MDFAAVLKEIEIACDDYQTPATRVAAEQLLLRFRKQPNIVAPCIYIIENTSNYLASFQAASALQECILREWTLHAMQDISSLRNRLMDVIGSRQFPRQSLYALKKLYETVAIILKRSYLDDDSLMNDTLGQARNLFQSPDTRLRIIAAGILKAILDQFSLTKSTSVGLSYEFHHHCKVKFEKNVLRPCFEWILQELFTNVQHMKQSNPLSAESREYLGKCIEFAEKVMTWNFTPDGEQKVMGTIKRQAKDDEAPDTMDIPESWLDIFTNSDVLNMFFQLHSLLSDDNLFADLHVHTHLSTQILLSFYSTTATCLPDSHIHNYMRSLTQGLIGLFTGLSMNAQSFNWGRNLVGVSEMSHRFIRGFGIERLGGVLEFKDLVGHMLSCTVQVFAMNANDLDDTWCGEAIEEFLAMWSALVNQFQFLTSRNPLPVIPNFDYHSFGQELSNISHKIFAAYVESKVQQAILEMDDTDEDETGFKDWDTYSDQLLCITALTRISPKPCLHLLLSHLTDSLNTLSSIFTALSSPSPPHTQQINPLSEKLQWIIIIAGYVLADKGEGETPLIPDSIKAIFAENDTIVVDIIQRVLQTIQLLINDPNSVQAVYSSPLLFESLWWFITRFIPTYLYFNPSDYYSLPDSLIKSLASPEYVPESTAGNFLTLTLETIELSFKAWNAEIDVVKQLTFALLSMAKTPSIRNQILSHQKFHSLVMVLISSFANFPSDTHSSLIESIFKIVTLSQAPEELKTQYFTAVTGAMEREVTNLVGKNENAGGAGDVERVVNLLEMFNGLALAIDFSNAIPIYNFFLNFFPTFTHLYNTFHSQTILPTYIFQLYSTVVTHITFEQLSHDQWSALCRAVMDSLRIFESTEVRKKRNTKLERDEEVGQDIIAVVKLLANLMAAEFDGAGTLIFV